MPEYNEQEIIDGCKKQKQLFQEQLYRKYYGLFLKLCMRYANNIHDAEQLINDGFLKIFASISSYEGKGSFVGWMRKIIVNTCLDYIKSKQNKDDKNTHYKDAISETNLIQHDSNALQNLSFKELLILIQSLPATSKTVFNLFVFEGYSHKEIGKIMEISEGTSQWHVNNARKILQTKLNNHKIKAIK